MEAIFPKERSFIMRNLDPKSLRRNLRRVVDKSFWGGVEIEATMRDGKTIGTFTCGEVRGGALVGTEVHVPLADIVRLQVTCDPAVFLA
jgi:hypothetical protein